ncbi:MAG: hypothetical protein AAGI46_02460 [Planctomycetota bacterium]
MTALGTAKESASPQAAASQRDLRQLRIACNGYVDAGSGSIAAAGHRLLDSLLARGHRIDFFSKPSFVYPSDLLERHDTLRYRRAEDSVAERIKRVATRVVGQQFATPVSLLQHRVFARVVMRKMRADHAADDYDAVLFLGTPAFGRVGNVRTVSWVQGGAGTDVRSIRDRHDLLRRSEKSWRLMLLQLYGKYRMAVGSPDYSACDALVCGSSFSRQRLIADTGLPSESIVAQPYPLDFSAFKVRQ